MHLFLFFSLYLYKPLVGLTTLEDRTLLLYEDAVNCNVLNPLPLMLHKKNLKLSSLPDGLFDKQGSAAMCQIPRVKTMKHHIPQNQLLHLLKMLML